MTHATPEASFLYPDRTTPHQIENELLPTLLIEETARKLCVDSAHTWRHLGDHFESSTMHFERMLAHSPRKAEYLVWRGMWDALQAPLNHAIEITLAERVQRAIKNGEPFAPQHIRESDALDAIFSIPYEGSNLAFMRAASYWSHGAASKCLDEIAADPEHWCYPIWEAFSALHQTFSKAEAAYAPTRLSRPRPELPHDELRFLAVDSNETVLPLLRSAAAHFDHWSASPEKAESLRPRIIGQLAWAASIKGHFIPQRVVTGYSQPKRCLFSHMRLSTTGGIWAHPPIANGPQEVSGYCPANVLLQSPRFHDQQVVESAYGLRLEIGGADSQADRPYGWARAAELRCKFLFYVAQEIF